MKKLKLSVAIVAAVLCGMVFTSCEYEDINPDNDVSIEIESTEDDEDERMDPPPPAGV